jgi:hypothetical protein
MILTHQNHNSLQVHIRVINAVNTPNTFRPNSVSKQIHTTANPDFTNRVKEKLLAVYQGFQTRRQVAVDTVAPGIIKTTIRRPPGITSQNKSHPLERMQSLLRPGATYVRMHIIGGGQSSCVIGTRNNEAPQSPLALATQARQGSAVINGGYFVHKHGLVSDDSRQLSIGSPIGQTASRTDSIPVPDIWKDEYGQIVIDDEIVLTSGPVLALKGEQIKLPDHDRLKYHVDERENPLNNYAGALTHSSGYNERAAISALQLSETGVDDNVMHALTSNGDRTAGASMTEWQALTSTSVASLPGPHSTGQQNNSSTINLDGGGSVFLGTTTESGIVVHALGGASSVETIRPVANVIVSTPQNTRNK